ncbi:glycine zipper domain-containing protein [Croceibacterium sp. TMG7-5b_MA50]|uniref:glycine zipper domain-containing protein n=1 Tax=Croceibacterium sp. TMG7-5b_MA50 TaxID=3121290 RepID=UPI003221FDD4
MINRVLLASVVSAAALSLGACANNYAAEGGLAGAAAGAGIGAVTGGDVGTGAAVGGAAGAVGGALIDRNDEE